MNKIAVIYESKYGSTQKYAQWIAEEVNGDLFHCSKVNVEKLMQYNVIVYGGGLYASGIAGVSVITKNFESIKDKKIIVFTVGLASTDRKEIFAPIVEKNFSETMRNSIKFFHLRGGINYKELNLIHKLMMAMLKTVITRKAPDEMTDDDKQLLATYGTKVDLTNKNTIKLLVDYVKS
ncbi:flavodoxin domain-containing protein [Tissierella sp. MSJ-40]|uniref:Flavodoxin domain-containing protein n=1 Tax=Tissierella simiarum TaxID=2841534 RepID=A0ABS6E9I7_9FIRM|nr:flavodoxin domain-containing protein [Tissierella simiarum]MBU5439437.1 flavodoxin domain-containing protein [Tissierella simiarum]